MDTVANMLTIINNAQAVRKTTVIVPYSRLKYEIAKILEQQGFILSVEKKIKNEKNGKTRLYLEITLKYIENLPAISGFKKFLNLVKEYILMPPILKKLNKDKESALFPLHKD